MKELIRSIACSICKALSGEPKELDYKLISSKKISRQDLYVFLKNKFPSASLWLSDKEYTLCHYDDIAYFLAISQIDKLIFKAEKMDCDEFAAALWGEFNVPPWGELAIGYLWTEVHALNCVITEDKELLFLEPQTDELNKWLASWQGTQPKIIII